MNWSINLPKVCDPRDQACLRFCLILSEIKWSINLPKVCGSRDQAWLRFYLILKQIVELMTCDIINLNVVNKAFINNNTFSGYLHSRGVVRHFPLNLQDNMHYPNHGYDTIWPFPVGSQFSPCWVLCSIQNLSQY